jgi:hypothetical protein
VQTPIEPSAGSDPVETPRSIGVDVPDRASAWTIPLLCAGIAIIACCLLIPAADENRRLAYEREKLRLDLEQIKTQVSINDEFLHRIGDDPGLLERLAQRQMKLVRQGTAVLSLKSETHRDELSPYMLVTLPPPVELAPYRPLGGVFASMCRNPRTQLFLMGGAMLLVAAGLVMGTSPGKSSATS